VHHGIHPPCCHVTRNVNLRLHLPVIGRSRIFIKGITTSYRVLN
jgi:hypothetical protein